MFAAHALHDAAIALRDRFRNAYPEHVGSNEHFGKHATRTGTPPARLRVRGAEGGAGTLAGPSKPDRHDLYSGASGHDLVELAEAATRVRLTDDAVQAAEITRQVWGHLISHEARNRLSDVEREVLRALTGFAVYAGRYPTPLSTMPREGPPWSERPIWNASWDPVVDALWERYWNRAQLAGGLDGEACVWAEGTAPTH